MLVLTRKIGERVMIGPDVEIAVVKVRGNSVRLGVTAPREVRVHRAEVQQKIQENESALVAAFDKSAGTERDSIAHDASPECDS